MLREPPCVLPNQVACRWRWRLEGSLSNWITRRQQAGHRKSKPDQPGIHLQETRRRERWEVCREKKQRRSRTRGTRKRTRRGCDEVEQTKAQWSLNRLVAPRRKMEVGHEVNYLTAFGSWTNGELGGCFEGLQLHLSFNCWRWVPSCFSSNIQ